MFKFKGISSKEMDVCVTEIDNLIRKAPQRYEEIYIDGRDGAFFHPLEYSPIEVPLELTLMKPERIDEVLQWLNGTGWLEYNGRKTQAHIFSEVEPVRASTVRLIQVTIIRNPFWEKVEDNWSEAWGANLIQNGWDDFEPYGGGKNLTPYPKVEEYMSSESGSNAELKFEYQQSFIEAETNNAIRITTTGATSNKQIRIRLDNLKEVDRKLTERIQIKNNSNHEIKFFTGIIGHIFIKSGEYKEIEVTSKNSYPKMFNGYIENVEGNHDIDVTIFRHEITEEGDYPLTVEKTSLGNGLTRIQTWGGNSNAKLLRNYGKFTKSNTFSFNIKNIGKNTIRVRHNQPWLWEDVLYQTSTFINIRSNGHETRPLLLNVLSIDENDKLDFIASDPVIVEGDRAPNWQATSDPAIYNEGTAVSKPLIKLEKGKDRQCEFEVNGTYFKFHFNDDDHVILDCEEMEATYNGFNRNRHLTIGFEWPKLKPKENFVKRISGDAKILFKRKDRWL